MITRYCVYVELGLMLRTQRESVPAIWNFSSDLSRKVLVADMKRNFLHEFNSSLVSLLNTDKDSLSASLREQISHITERSVTEKSYWLDRIEQINNYSREQAIGELIKYLGINEKINHIDAYIATLTS